MVSYWKSKWLMICCGLAHLGISIASVFSGDLGWALAWFVVASLWLVGSRIEYNTERITQLEKKAEKYDTMYALVQELIEANKLDREHMDIMASKIKHIAKYIDFSGEPKND